MKVLFPFHKSLSPNSVLTFLAWGSQKNKARHCSMWSDYFPASFIFIIFTCNYAWFCYATFSFLSFVFFLFPCFDDWNMSGFFFYLFVCTIFVISCDFVGVMGTGTHVYIKETNQPKQIGQREHLYDRAPLTPNWYPKSIPNLRTRINKEKK